MSSSQKTRILGFLPALPELGLGESAACAVPTMASNAAHVRAAVLDIYSHLQRLVLTIPVLLVTHEFASRAPKERSRRFNIKRL